jgi:hypothetical protein
MPNRFRIEVGETTVDTMVTLNGEPIDGLTRVSFDLNPSSLTMVKLELIGTIEVDGEFREDAIFTGTQAQRPPK